MGAIFKTKTFWAAIGSLIVSVGGFFAGDVTQAAAIPGGIIAVLSIFLRQALVKVSGGVADAITAATDATASANVADDAAREATKQITAIAARQQPAAGDA